ncbi:hypothetical protein SAMD00019534_025750 [Acytostelium subglobosum LB1]|uniref:hypothetical protein n=1 Tax=Acytostelium subglobosum LB1 TaxID=1410327 RepID=UPI00064508C0|nr:hypothetical protein SAMD00019534_025750 [Acytostelium subglobosum LB1]GAM19400.1 hypothetical protein SAMD00019534_025750 [Acytostelium subglobosum LB1]|eukprot:XP_012757327.1 hypothetical protein SAMD00019534_025750 [Acytostelium subglobosum LB1]
MINLLQRTLSSEVPAIREGQNANGLVSWRWLHEGIVEVTPKQHCHEDQSVVLSAGIHGNETAPIELLDRLVNDIMNGQIPLAVRMLAIIGNPMAVRSDQRYIKADMNRMFGGRHSKFEPSEETARAQLLESVVRDFINTSTTCIHLDMHTAIRQSLLPQFGVLPFNVPGTPPNPKLLDLLDASGLDALVLHTEPGGAFTHYTGELTNASSCTLELGKALPLGHNNLDQFTSYDQVMRSLVSGGCTSPAMASRSARSPIRVFRVLRSVINPVEWILFPNTNVALGLRAGIVLTEVPRSTLFQS